MIDIEKAISILKKRRQIFVSEADFQLELAWVLKDMYPEAKVRLEYCPSFDINMHIDILIILNDSWIPIELKYKTKGCKKTIDDEIYNLKNHGAKDKNSYLYLHDIERIESIKYNCETFVEGYTIMITNDLSYVKAPTSSACKYADFSIEEGAKKQGTLKWKEGTSAGTMKGVEKPIPLKGKYDITWNDYSVIDGTNTGKFIYLINKIS